MEKRRVLITGLGTVNPLGHNAADTWQAVRDGVCGIGPITRYDCSDVYKRQVLDRAGLTPEDIDLFVFHQANQRIIDFAVKKLGIDPARCPGNIERTGNTLSLIHI